MRARHSRKDLPVVVLGAGITVLGAIRSLGRAGITAYCISDEPGVEGSSRWYRPIPPPFPPLAEGTQLETYLESLPFEKAVVLPCSDSWATRVAALPDPISRRFVSSSPPASVLELFVDKAKFEHTLSAHAVPHPITYLPRSEADIAAIDGPLDGYFLKPRDSQGFFQRFAVKGYWVRSREDCLALFGQLSAAGFEVMLQEYVPGPASNHYYVEGLVDRHGAFPAVFARRRLRMYPSDFGNSTLMVSIGHAEVEPAIRDVQRLLRAVHYRGIFSAELKRDARTGVFKLIEINARPWWYIEFAALCGMNVAEMSYYDALGEDVPAVTSYARGITSVNFYTDWQVWSRLPATDRPKLSECLPAWLFGHHTVLSWSDPFPALRWLDGLVRGKLRSLLSGRQGGLSRGRPHLGSSVSPG